MRKLALANTGAAQSTRIARDILAITLEWPDEAPKVK